MPSPFFLFSLLMKLKQSFGIKLRVLRCACFLPNPKKVLPKSGSILQVNCQRMVMDKRTTCPTSEHGLLPSFRLTLIRCIPKSCIKVVPWSFNKNQSSFVLISLILNFSSKVTNIITLIFQVLLLRLLHRPLSWQQSI